MTPIGHSRDKHIFSENITNANARRQATGRIKICKQKSSCTESKMEVEDCVSNNKEQEKVKDDKQCFNVAYHDS